MRRLALTVLGWLPWVLLALLAVQQQQPQPHRAGISADPAGRPSVAANQLNFTSGLLLTPTATDTEGLPLDRGTGRGKSAIDSNTAAAARLHRARNVHVEVWGKAAIGNYLWEHVLGAEIESHMGGVWSSGKLRHNRLDLMLRTGPGVRPSKVPKDTRHVVLVLNGHSPEKIPQARQWLDVLPKLPQLKTAGVVLHGNESCLDDWFWPYLASPAHRIAFVYMVYGSQKMMDHALVRQWPLGVATYRGFPTSIPVASAVGHTVHGSYANNPHAAAPAEPPRRRFLCNLQATIYPGSTRETLMAVLAEGGFEEDCVIRTRAEWTETEADPDAYLHALLDSEYTLAPAGRNTECYRYYEAAAAGSTPIVEDIAQPSTCRDDPLRILKDAGAPFIFLSDWHELPDVLAAARKKTPAELERQRQRLVQWYDDFKRTLRGDFLRTLELATGAQSLPA